MEMDGQMACREICLGLAVECRAERNPASVRLETLGKATSGGPLDMTRASRSFRLAHSHSYGLHERQSFLGSSVDSPLYFPRLSSCCRCNWLLSSP